MRNISNQKYPQSCEKWEGQCVVFREKILYTVYVITAQGYRLTVSLNFAKDRWPPSEHRGRRKQSFDKAVGYITTE